MNLQTRNNRQGEKIHLHLDKDIEAKLSIVTVYFLDYKPFQVIFHGLAVLYSIVTVREQHQGLIQTPLSTRIISKLTALPTDAMLLWDGASICDLVASWKLERLQRIFFLFDLNTRRQYLWTRFTSVLLKSEKNGDQVDQTRLLHLNFYVKMR